MKNIERLAKHIAKNGAGGTLVHTIPGTNNWIICQKIEEDKWMLTLCNPMGNITYNLGTVNNEQHMRLWKQITMMEINGKVSQIQIAKVVKDRVHRFIKAYESNYKKFIHRKKKHK